jgi:hypothetical protein
MKPTAFLVHPSDPAADFSSLTQALAAAAAGDTVIVGPGIYSLAHTGETFPLRIPPGVAVEGAGRETTIIDGEGLFAPSFNPIRTDLSVVLMDNGASLSGVTVRNGGGHGLVAPPGVQVIIRNCEISGHGDHGIFLSGVTEAIITGNIFANNGTKRYEPSLPRGTGARQGHHLFAETKQGQKNRLIITDNTMRACFADGIAFVCFFPEPDGVVAQATILRNTIEESERGGLLFSASFGPSRNRLSIEAADNILRANKQFGISAIASVPLSERVPKDNTLHALFTANEISNSPIGIMIQGGVGEAVRNAAHITVDRNRIRHSGRNAIRILVGMATDAGNPIDNRITAALTRNFIEGGSPAIILQGAAGTPASTPQNNSATARITGNTVSGEQAIAISNGRPGNQVEITEGSQPFTRTESDLVG